MKNSTLKKFAAITTASLMGASLLVGCGSSSDSAASASASKASSEAPAEKTDGGSSDGKYLIGFAMSTYDDQWLSYLVDCAQEYAKEVADEAEFTFTDAENDIAIQLGQVEQMITNGCDAIIVNPVETDSSGPMVEACAAAGIPIIAVNRPLANGDDGSEPSCTVAGDSKQSGVMCMEYLAKIADGKGKVAIIGGEPTHEASVLRMEGMREVVAQNPDMEIVFEQNAENWERAKAMSVTEDLIASGTEFDIIAACCDEIAAGAILALQDAGYDVSEKGIMVGGIDGSPVGLGFMREGSELVDVFQDAKGQGTGAMKAALALCKGETIEKDQTVSYELITMDNIEEYEARWAGITG